MAVKSVPQLIAGPYAAPAANSFGPRQKWLTCAINGDVPVAGMTDGPIPWPYTRYRGAGVRGSTQPMLIVCGDLERAIRTESAAAVRYWFGVSRSTVHKWRRALKTGRMTPGTQRLLNDHARAKLTDLTPKKLALIRRGIAGGCTDREIEAKFGVHWRTVWRIRTGATFVE